MSNPTDKASIIFHPAECANCTDEDCPYTHRDGWEIEGTGDWSHNSEAEAIAARDAITPTDKASVAAREDLHETFQEILAGVKPEWMMDVEWSETLFSLVDVALSPAQGDGMRDALVKAFNRYIERANADDADYGAIDLAAVAMRVIASHPRDAEGASDRQRPGKDSGAVAPSLTDEEMAFELFKEAWPHKAELKWFGDGTPDNPGHLKLKDRAYDLYCRLARVAIAAIKRASQVDR